MWVSVSANLLEQLVRLLEPTRGLGAASRLPMPVLPFLDAGDHAGDLGNRRHWLSLHPGRHPSISTTRRTGRRRFVPLRAAIGNQNVWPP